MAELPVIKRLKKDLETLKHELTVDLPKELERARAHGDLSENAEWAMAKQRQEFLRARVSNLETRIAELTMIDLETIPRDTVGLGSRVQLEDLDEGGSRGCSKSSCRRKLTARRTGSRCRRRWARANRQGGGGRYRSRHAQGQARVHGEEADDDPRADGRRERHEVAQSKVGLLAPHPRQG